MRAALGILLGVSLVIGCGGDPGALGEDMSGRDRGDERDRGAPEGDGGARPNDGAGGDSDGADVATDGPPIEVTAENATYTMEAGGQVDALLAAPYVGIPGIAFELIGAPAPGAAEGELLHFDPAIGRFVFTSLTVGSVSIDYAILLRGVERARATMTIEVQPLDFVGDWNLQFFGGQCPDHPFTVTRPAETLLVEPVASRCLEMSAGITLASGNTYNATELEQRVAVQSCATDLRKVQYCIAFAVERIGSRGDFWTINTVSGTRDLGKGQMEQIGGAATGLSRRVGEKGEERATLVPDGPPLVQLRDAVSDSTPRVVTVTLYNRGTLEAVLGEVTLPEQLTIEGGFPGPGGTCAGTLGPRASCTFQLTITPTQPEKGDTVTVPMVLRYADESGFDLLRLPVRWRRVTPPP